MQMHRAIKKFKQGMKDTISESIGEKKKMGFSFCEHDDEVIRTYPTDIGTDKKIDFKSCPMSELIGTFHTRPPISKIRYEERSEMSGANIQMALKKNLDFVCIGSAHDGVKCHRMKKESICHQAIRKELKNRKLTKEEDLKLKKLLNEDRNCLLDTVTYDI